jgi:hypothetical protein
MASLVPYRTALKELRNAGVSFASLFLEEVFERTDDEGCKHYDIMHAIINIDVPQDDDVARILRWRDDLTEKNINIINVSINL